MVYIANCNYLNQYPNVNKAVEAMKSLEFIAAQEQFMTPTAKFADIILPTCTFFERNDAVWGAGPHVAYQRKVIEPLGESRSHLAICDDLAARLGIVGYNDKTDEQWLEQIMTPCVGDFEKFKETGVKKYYNPPSIPFKKEIADIENSPFPTPSGKIEIFSQQIADMNNPLMPPIPKYIEPWESRNDPLARKYPIQMTSTHPKRRSHSQFDNIPWLREVDPQVIWLNGKDAKARGIKDGDLVKVFNKRGEVIIKAKVTERIMPGVADLPEGAWYDPDKKGVDHGGCANVLTIDKRSPGGAFTSNSCLVQVEKA
jgi:anaerobic dimethyl sulfoxide reductase subunit A